MFHTLPRQSIHIEKAFAVSVAADKKRTKYLEFRM